MKQRIISLLLAAALILTFLQQFSISVFATDNTVKFKSVTAHGNVTAAITTSGDLYMWGKNDYGQVGNGTTTDQETPVKVLSNVASASINVFNFSDSYCAAITTNGDLYMWGYNAYGQVGNGTTTDQKTPFKVLSNVASISIDGFHSAAITTNGDLYMWGRNQRGQVGNGATTIQKTPVKVLSNVASVSISDSYSAAITTNGDLYMWGYNAYGKVGNGTTTDQKTPVKVLSNVTSVSLTSCSAAITTNGDLYTWGCNDYGQLGNGTTTHQKTPVKVLSNVASISISSCSAAITTNGDLYMWGANDSGQVGNGTTTDQKTPVKVLSNVEFVNSGWGRNAAITTNGDLYMWGLNHRGQVGNGTTTNQKTPLKVLSNVVSVTPYDDLSAAITTNGDLYMWGYNNHGQVGNGTTSDQKTPLKILSNIESVDLELFWRSAAITTNGDLYMWGFNNCGQVGNGTTADQLTPYQIVVPDSSATSNDSFNTFFVNNYYDNLNALYNYESVAQGIKTSSFQIVWNNCLQALSNSNYIDISKLENHPEYYYEVVLVEAISQKELNDDYLSALKTEAFDLVLDAADVFISYDANFNSHEEILEAKLTETINLFDGTSEGAHALYQAFMGCVSYKSYKDFYDEAKFVYDACKEAGSTCSDFLTELSNYQVAQQASAEVIEALKYLRSTLEDSSDKEEKNIASAIDDFIQLYSESIGETALRQASEAIDEQLRGTLFRAAKLIPIFGNAVDLEQAGLNAVFTFSDVLFPTTMSSENYCKIYADYAMECVLRNAMQSACSSRSTVGDDVIVGLYDLLGFTYKHEIQVAQVLAEQLYHDGLLNGLRNLFTDREERYNYDKACIKAYQADLYQILGKKTDAIREYGLEIGASQIVTLVFMQNGKVIACSELAIPTGSTYSPSTGTFDLGGFFNTKIEIGTFYTDAALTIPYDKDQKVYSPVSLYCNVKLTDLSSNAPIMVDYSTGIYVEQNGIDETAILQTQEKHDGASYDLINNTLKSNAFSLYDISLLKNGTPVQPTETVTVRIPISEADTKKAGKVYRVENNSKFTDMASWIEGGYYCFNTNHFSEYVVAFEPLISDDVICDGGVNCPSNKFIDVNQKEWYHPYVDYAVTHGLFGGTSENTFEPDSTMTRSMLVTVLWRYEGQPKGYKNTFADVNAKNGGWYIDAVAWAAANNIVGGVGGGKFDPEGIVTREQMATILYRYSEWKGFDTSKRADFSFFPDANKVSSWAKTAMKWAVAEGLIGGSKEGNATYILPTNGATRAQVATILMRYIQGLTEEIPYDPMGHSYEYVRGMYSWAQAQKIAEEKGGYLVRFDSLREFNYIATQLSKNEYQNTVFVIGARRAESSKDYYFVDFNDKPVGGKINDSSWFSSCWAAGEPTYEWDGVQEWILAMAYDSSHSTWKINDIVDNLSYPSDPNCHGFIIEYDNKDDPAPEESYHIALITDYGDINDASYNQAAYEAGRAWCEKNSADFTYYKPIEDSTEARVAVIDQAVADGYNVLILPGFTFADPIVETAGLYPDVRFIGLDISEDDLKFAAYDNPAYTCPSNVFCALYKEEIGGFMAGYAAVKLGYTKLGFLGGMPVPAVVRYGYGFIQGVDTASTELGIKTEIRYVYGNQFFGDADITAYMENWYRSGTQVVFACGGGIFTSVAEAAQKYSGKLIGLDVDQASTIDELYGTGMTVTSAMKGLGETVTFMLDELISGRWNVHGGKIETLGLISGSDPSANFVQLPDFTQWNSGFTKSDYAALVSKIYNGTYIVSADIDIMPTTKSVTVLNEGAIKS